MATVKIGVLVGSARKGSYSLKIARALSGLLPEGFEAHFIKMDQLPLYNQDYDDEGNVPAQWVAFRERIAEMDGFLFVTPEYNRSVTPLLKNALDIASRPPGSNLWKKKPSAVIGISPGQLGGFGACQHLRQAMACVNIPVMSFPEVYLGKVGELLDDAGNVSSEDTLRFLEKAAGAFAAWVNRFLS